MANKTQNRTLLPRTARNKSLQQSSIHDNEFKAKQRISQQLKQKYIQDLEQRNRKLKNEIQKITQILEQNEQKQNEKMKQRLKNNLNLKNYKSPVGHSPQQNNPEFLKKQLEKVYKLIKNYERQIQKTQNTRVGSKSFSDQIARLQTIKYQKLQHLQKLNTEVSLLSNQQALNSKKLRNNMGREFYENQIIIVGEQLKALRQKLKTIEEREKKKVANAKKQYEYIKQLQSKLVEEGGVAMDEIQELKKKNIYIQIKNIMSKDKTEKPEEEYEENINGQIDQEEQQIITYEKLDEMKNQIKLYKKLHQDYEKRLVAIQKQKTDADQQITDKKKTLDERNTQIQKLNQEINEIKQLVRKNNAVTNGTIAGQPDSIRKLQRKKSIDVALSAANSKSKQDKKSTKLASHKLKSKS